MIESLKSFFAGLQDDAGQTMAEYAVVLGVITIAVVIALTFLSGTITSLLSNVVSNM